MSRIRLRLPLKLFNGVGGLSQVSYGVRVFVALCGAMILSLAISQTQLVIPLFLGIIASALSETEDSWQGRFRAVMIMLICFVVTAFGVTLLMPHPILFGISIVVSAFCLSICGALGPRYAAIAQATLILAVYTMIGLNQATHPLPFWYEPALLGAGALWYGILSILWAKLFAHIPLRQALANLYLEVGRYLKLKAELFPPESIDSIDGLRLRLARQHGQVVNALNQVREILVRRIQSQPDNPRLGRYIRLYFTAQSIHERASSSHYRYSDLAEAFFHSDILFRLGRQLYQEGVSCIEIARAISTEQRFDLGNSEAALEQVKRSLAHLEGQDNEGRRALLASLRQLAGNVSSLQQELVQAQSFEDVSVPDALEQIPQPRQSVRSVFARIREHFTPKAVVFRHAVRMMLSLTVGYLLIHTLDLELGYWVMLTVLFVCLPTFGSTQKRLYERIAGTVVGLVLAWALITLFPATLIQLLIAVAAGVVFFLCRGNRYLIATAAITLMVVCCFNQVVDGYGVIWPRLVDTLIGSLIAGFAVIFILPDWRYRQLHVTLAESLRSSSLYLIESMNLYREQGDNEQSYRHARRRAYNADAVLSATLATMMQEPSHLQHNTELWQRLVIRSHTLFNYIAAFGAHRGVLEQHPQNSLLVQAAECVASGLHELADALADREGIPDLSQQADEFDKLLSQLPDETDDRYHFLVSQLPLLFRQLEQIRQLAGEWQASSRTRLIGLGN